MWNQFFYYFGPMMEDENKICLTVHHKKSKWGSIDLADMVDAVYNLSDSENKQNFNNLGQLYISNLKKNNRNLFEFTPRHNFSAEQLVDNASKGLERKNMTYERIDSDRMFNYLRRIQNDNRFRGRLYQQPNAIIEANNESDADRPYTFPLGRYLNDNHIETLIEYLHLIDQGKTDKTSDDLIDALGRDPQDLFQFFKRNRDQFRRFR